MSWLYLSRSCRAKNIPQYHTAVVMTIVGANVVPWSTKCSCIVDFDYFECLEFFTTRFSFIDLSILWDLCYLIKLQINSLFSE